MTYVEDFRRKVQGASAWIHPLRNEDGTTWGRRGTVTTPFGIVEVFVTTWRAGGKREGYQVVNLDAVVDGVEHTRRYERPPSRTMTDRGIATVAHRWIRDLVENANTEG